MRVEPAAGFSSDDDFLAAIALELGHQALAASIAIDVGCIKEIYTQIDCPVERRQRLAILNLPPHAADGPGAETNFRDLPTRPPQFSILHDLPPMIADCGLRNLNPYSQPSRLARIPPTAVGGSVQILSTLSPAVCSNPTDGSWWKLQILSTLSPAAWLQSHQRQLS